MATHQYDPFWSAIEKALASRGKKANDYVRDPELRECNYVVRMCKGLLELIQAGGSTSTTWRTCSGLSELRQATLIISESSRSIATNYTKRLSRRGLHG